MSAFKMSIETAKRLHQNGQASQVHGIFEAGILKAAVYGATDGIITTFAVVAGVAGAGLSPGIIIIMGLANLVGDGLSMGISDYLGERSEQRHRRYQYAIEEWEIKHIPDEERKELEMYLENHGVAENDRKSLIGIIQKHPRLWSELGFIEEMGVIPALHTQIWKSGVVTFFSFVLAGFLPLIPYLFLLTNISIDSSYQFSLSLLATATALFITGSLRTFITKGRWWINGLEILTIGAIAASAAYLIGSFVEGLMR